MTEITNITFPLNAARNAIFLVRRPLLSVQLLPAVDHYALQGSINHMINYLESEISQTKWSYDTYEDQIKLDANKRLKEFFK
jgi:hypothetical protein|tara:strand:- start:619 stop:864 length:246 start_codon:yes stop_codon:yes gene_type:complete